VSLVSGLWDKKIQLTEHIKSKKHVKNKEKWLQKNQQHQSQELQIPDDLNQLNCQFRLKLLLKLEYPYPR